MLGDVRQKLKAVILVTRIEYIQIFKSKHVTVIEYPGLKVRPIVLCYQKQLQNCSSCMRTISICNSNSSVVSQRDLGQIRNMGTDSSCCLGILADVVLVVKYSAAVVRNVKTTLSYKSS